MATKLYPPNIEGTIPAFSGTTLVVPFSLNRAVSKNEIMGFALKIKTVQGSVLLKTIRQTTAGLYDVENEMKVYFDMSGIPLNVGQYYKIQLAFIDSTQNVGYYSTVGVVKYTSTPYVAISGLTAGKINNHNYHYNGLYSQAGKGKDSSEKLYSSRFRVYDSDNHLVHDSGELLHNVNNDTQSYEAYEKYDLNIDLEENTSYYITFEATTNNGYQISSPRYRIMQKKSVEPDLKATLDARLSYDDGYIDLYLIGDKNEEGIEQTVVGSFIVSRSASNNPNVWNTVYEFSLQAQTPTRFLWRDYTIEQGVTYRYSIQQYNDYGLYSNRILSNEILSDFEDAFLYEGGRQLKIRYNPKVSSFKTDVLEAKQDTIGSKHPFIFRNGNVYYKEFPISGLISYQMDDNQLFMNWDELGALVPLHTNRPKITKENMNKPVEVTRQMTASPFDFTSDTLLVERLFKLEVLKWLNNGEPKIFRSPTEGNYIVRLLNNSLTPTDQLGRMLHTFNSTAYEIADFTYDNLKANNFITIQKETSYQMQWATVELAGHSSGLDKILGSARRYVDAGVNVTITEEQYNRLLSYNYDLSNYFENRIVTDSYELASDVTPEQLEELGNILGGSVTADKVFTYTEYNKIIVVDEKYEDWFKANSTILTYQLSSAAVLRNNKVLTELESIIGGVTYATGTINTRPAYSIFAVDMLPGTIIQLSTDRAGAEPLVEEIQIGATGSYLAEFENPVTSIIIPQRIYTDGDGKKHIDIYGLQGSITYGYKSAAVNIFDLVRNIEVTDIPWRQWIGAQKKTYYDREKDKDVTTDDLIKIIEDEKVSITDIFAMRFEKRPLHKIFIKALYDINLAERDGIDLDASGNPPEEGVYLAPVGSKQAKAAINPTKFYYKTFRTVREQSSTGTVERQIPIYKLETEVDTHRDYYVKVYDFYDDMECHQKVTTFDDYFVYQICNARFDYTYKNVWYEKDYIDSNFEHGYYVDKDGNHHDVFTGYLLDGLSTLTNLIIYDSNTYSNKVYINGDELDLTQTERYSVVGLGTPVKSLKFDNGIICELSYQTREMIYNLEYSNESVNSWKAQYESSVSQLNAHKMLYELLRRQKADPDSVQQRDIDNYAVLLGGRYKAETYFDDNAYTALENEIMDNIKLYYSQFIRQLTIELKTYEEASSIR